MNPLLSDLDEVLAATEGLWEHLRGARLFVTGGTGFFGCWMLGTFAHANKELGLDAEAVVLSRDPARFATAVPEIAKLPAVSFAGGGLTDFVFPEGRFSHVLHMAAETNVDRSNPPARQYFDVSVDGTRRVLEFAAVSGVRQLLLTSSGAVYGRQPADIERLSEEGCLAPQPEDVGSAYGHGKRAAEFLCCAAHAQTGLEAKIARCFAFVGPYLPLDSGYAIGNFIGDALAGRPIRVRSDGSATRSYLYAGDLAAWLWTILLRGEPARPYNVGSEHAVSVRELAGIVASTVGGVDVMVDGSTNEAGSIRSRYVPDTTRVQGELGVSQTVSLEAAIERTAHWHRRDTGERR